jgi:hypothetical protein
VWSWEPAQNVLEELVNRHPNYLLLSWLLYEAIIGRALVSFVITHDTMTVEQCATAREDFDMFGFEYYREVLT